jgi:hypothetical protein
MAEPRPDAGSRWQDELRAVLLVAAQVVAVVLVIAAAAIFIPPVGQLFNRVPVAIAVLVVGTAWVLWRITRRPAAP